MQKQIGLLSVRNAFYKSFKAKSQRAIRLKSGESIFIIFAPSYVNSSRQNRFKCCKLHDLINIFLGNGVMTTPKCRILSFVFTVLCFKKSLLILCKLIANLRGQYHILTASWEKIYPVIGGVAKRRSSIWNIFSPNWRSI